MNYQHHFKKKFGQNFLKDENVLKRIIKEANIPNDTLVIEIGAGSGALTEKLQVVSSNVLSYEIDLELKDTLLEKFSNSNIKFIFDDFLNRDIKEDIKEYDNKNIYVVANIPYYITTPIIEKIIASDIDISKVILMVQKEVGERFSATPGNKNYGSISVFLNYFYDIKELFVVSKNCFIPKPNVDSVVISLEKKVNKLKVQDEAKFFKLIRDSFQYKRKNLKNNLKNYDLEKVEEILKKKNKDLTVRAESLDLETFIEISNNL